MSRSFTYLNSLKNNVCYSYYGLDLSYILQLDYLRPNMLEKFPKIQIFISCRPEFNYLLNNLDYYKPPEQEYGYNWEIGTGHESPLLKICEESGVPLQINVKKKFLNNNLCLLCLEGTSENNIDVSKYKKIAQSEGYSVQVVGSDIHQYCKNVDIRPEGKDKIRLVENAGYVLGVENEFVYIGAKLGLKVGIIGNKSNTFQKMFGFIPCY